MKYKLHENGRWDVLGEKIQLTGAYPAINGRAVSPTAISIGKEFVLYKLEKGCLKLRFKAMETGIAVSCAVYGLEGIHDIEPFSDAEICGAENVFVQGSGMEGPSGCHEISMEPKNSDGLIALFNKNKAFLVYALDHRRYINRYVVGKKQGIFSDDIKTLSGGFNLECTASEDETLPSLFFSEYDDLNSGLQCCAKKIAGNMGARASQPPAFHWCSWYYMYNHFDQLALEEYLKGFRRKNVNFRYIQIDDGYTSHHGDWLRPNHRFPEGLHKAAETIIKAGYEPGIWISPFMVGDKSELFRKHPDWILRDLNGVPVTELTSYNEPKTFGDSDCNYYVLDASHPEALAYISHVFKTLRGWGFSLFKTDFMRWNMHDTSKVKRFDPSFTSVEIFRNTLEAIREAIGDDSYLLGCIAPFLPFIGYADGMRIAGDVGAQWDGDYGPVNLLREITADNYFNHIYWQNDPDSVLLRDFDLHLKPREVTSLALLQALSGGIITTSDPVHRLSNERLELLRFITPKGKVRPLLPYLTQNRDDIVLVHRLKQGNLLYAMNTSDRPITVFYNFFELFGVEEWYAYQYGNWDIRKSSYYTATLLPHECAMLFLTEEPLENIPKNLWEW